MGLLYNFILIYFFFPSLFIDFYLQACAKLDDFAESKRSCKGLLMSLGPYQYFWEMCGYWCENNNRYVENPHMKFLQGISRARQSIHQHFLSNTTSSTMKNSSSNDRCSIAEYILNDVSATTIHSPDNLLGIWCTAWKPSKKSERVNS